MCIYTCRAADTGQQLNLTAGDDVTSQHYVSCRPITCDLNDGDVILTCCLHGNEPYVPFDALERYFEVRYIHIFKRITIVSYMSI